MDGAHCLRVLCSHPCCWDTERRCTRGIKHHTPARVRKHSLKNEDFPSLSIVNVSEWAGRGRPVKERPLDGADTDTEASLNDVSLSKQTQDTQKIKRANLSFPDIMLPSDKPNNMLKLNTVDISPLMGRSELPQCPVVMWIPNPHHEPQWLRQNKPTRGRSVKVIKGEGREELTLHKRALAAHGGWALALIPFPKPPHITSATA